MHRNKQSYTKHFKEKVRIDQCKPYPKPERSCEVETTCRFCCISDTYYVARDMGQFGKKKAIIKINRFICKRFILKL